MASSHPPTHTHTHIRAERHRANLCLCLRLQLAATTRPGPQLRHSALQSLPARSCGCHWAASCFFLSVSPSLSLCLSPSFSLCLPPHTVSRLFLIIRIVQFRKNVALEIIWGNKLARSVRGLQAGCCLPPACLPGQMGNRANDPTTSTVAKIWADSRENYWKRQCSGKLQQPGGETAAGEQRAEGAVSACLSRIWPTLG